MSQFTHRLRFTVDVTVDGGEDAALDFAKAIYPGMQAAVQEVAAAGQAVLLPVADAAPHPFREADAGEREGSVT